METKCLETGNSAGLEDAEVLAGLEEDLAADLVVQEAIDKSQVAPARPNPCGA